MLTHKKILIAALAIYCLTAIFSTGYYHPDEHFQIIEFAEYKAGHNLASDLTWEYKARIRPASQPALFYVLSYLLRLVGVSDNYVIIMIVRIITGIVSIVVISLFVEKTKNNFDPLLQKLYLLLAYFLWFMPFLNVRFSSETWSGFLFLTGIIFFYSQLKHKWFLMGVFLGLSFVFRFQTAFMSLGLLLWLLLIQKIQIRQLCTIMLGAFFIFVGGTIIDYWFYQGFNLTFYNYFFENVVKNDAAHFGIFPWHFYITSLFENAGFPIALLIIICLILYIFFYPKGIITWILVPFIAVHLIIPHKELRFMFPLVNLLPMIIIGVLNRLFYLYTKFKSIRFLTDTIVVLLGTYNFIFLVMVMLSPADKGYINMTEFITKNYKQKKVHLYGYGVDDPYNTLYILHQNYYGNKNVHFEFFKPPLLLNHNRSEVSLILIHSADYMGWYNYRDLVNKKLKIVYTATPIWLFYFKAFLSDKYANENLYLFEVDKTKQ